MKPLHGRKHRYQLCADNYYTRWPKTVLFFLAVHVFKTPTSLCVIFLTENNKFGSVVYLLTYLVRIYCLGQCQKQ